MGNRRGDFEGSSSITVGELMNQPGKFGFIRNDDLRFNGNKVCFETSTLVERHANGAPFRVECVKGGGGFNIEFVGFDKYAGSIRPPKGKTVPVKKITAGGKTYAQWSDELLFNSVQNMRIGSSGYVSDFRIAESGGKPTIPSFEQVYQRGSKAYQRATQSLNCRFLPIQRKSRDRYEIGFQEGGWTELKVTK